MSRLTRDGTAEPVSRDQILRHARGQGNIIYPVQLTTSRIGNLARLIHTLLYVMTIHTHTYIHTMKSQSNSCVTSNINSNTVCVQVGLILTANNRSLALKRVRISREWSSSGISARWVLDSHAIYIINKKLSQRMKNARKFSDAALYLVLYCVPVCDLIWSKSREQ